MTEHLRLTGWAWIAACGLMLDWVGVAHAAERGWTIDPQSGCRVANANPQPNESVTWSGGCVKGLAQGQGVLQWFEHGRPTERYEGDMRAGEMDGQGTLSAGAGGRYVGGFRGGKAEGQGEWSSSGGQVSGIWHGGCLNDSGRRAFVGVDPASCP